MNRTIAAVAGDPGGANALLPVLLLLREAGHNVLAWPYYQAEALWRNASLVVEALPSDVDARHRLSATQPDLLLTATSMNELNLEKKFIAAASQRTVPSIALLDFWSNYRKRFEDASGRLAFLPDRIAVMDQVARDNMMREGFDAATLVITGQPAFDALADFSVGFTDQSRNLVRQRLGIVAGERFVVFVSQPITEIYGDQVRYNEHSVLHSLIQALERIQERSGVPLVLLVRPHPRESLAKYKAVQSASLKVIVSAVGDGREVALASDMVVGMTTILLLEACMMGAVVVSIQPGCRDQDKDPLPCNREGFSRVVYDAVEVEPTLEQMLFDAGSRAHMQARLAPLAPSKGATQRLFQLIESMLPTGGSRS